MSYNNVFVVRYTYLEKVKAHEEFDLSADFIVYLG